MKSKKNIDIIIIISVFIVFIFAFRKLWGLGMFAYNDCIPFPENTKDAFKMLISSWDGRSPGLNLPLRHGSFICVVQSILISLCVGNAAFAQKIFLFLPMPLAFISMFFFLSRFEKNRFAKIITAFIYSVNPMTIGELQGGWVQNIYVQAFLPLILLYLFKLRINYKLKYMIVCSMILSIAYMLAEHVLIFLFPFVIYWFFSDVSTLYKNHSLNTFKKRFIVLLSLGTSCFLLTLPQTFFFLKAAVPFLGGKSLLRAEVLQMLTFDVDYCYGQSGFKTILKFGAGFHYLPILAFLPSILALFSLFSLRSKEKRRIVGLFMIAALTIILFIWLTYKNLTFGIFRNMPFLFRFRNHARPLLLLTFVYTPLIAIGTGWILNKIKAIFRFEKRIIISGLFVLFLFSTVITYNRSILWGDFGLLRSQGENLVIPRDFYDISNWLNSKRQKEGDFRTLWFPWEFNEEEVKLAWLDTYTLSLPIGYGQYAYTPLIDYIASIFRVIQNNSTNHLGAFLIPANVRYVVLYLKSKQKGDIKVVSAFFTPYIFGCPEAFKKFLDKQQDLELIVKQSEYLIYKNTRSLPKDNLMCYNNIILVSNSSMPDPFLVFSQLINKKLIDPSKDILVFKEQLKEDIDLFKNIYMGETVFLEPLLYDDFNSDILDRRNWMQVPESTYSINNGEIVLPLERGKIEYLLSRQEFVYPMTFEMRLKICRSDLPADIRIEMDGSHGVGLLYSGKLRTETYRNWKVTTVNIGDFDPTDYHIYKIIWEKNKVQFFIDNNLEALHKTNITNNYIKIRFGGASGQVFKIDYIKASKGKSIEPIEIHRISNNKANKLDIKKEDNAEYEIKAQNLDSLFLLLSEAYNKYWQAHCNTMQFVHFPAFYCFNGFYAKDIENPIKVIYRTKKIKQYSVILSMIAWIFMLFLLCVVRNK